MIRALTVALVLLTGGISQAGLQANFAASFGKYQLCVGGGHGTSKCFKLYCDPQGIIEARMTAFYDIPTLGGLRTDGIKHLETHPEYTGLVEFSGSDVLAGREMTASKIFIQAVNQMNPPTGFIELFTLQTGDTQDVLGAAGAFGGFRFDPGDYVKIFDTDTQQVIMFDHTQIQDVMFPFTPEPSSSVLAVGLMTAAAAIRRKFSR
jgi:hypothetical protein